jgi:hypothetical protein
VVEQMKRLNRARDDRKEIDALEAAFQSIKAGDDK